MISINGKSQANVAVREAFWSRNQRCGAGSTAVVSSLCLRVIGDVIFSTKKARADASSALIEAGEQPDPLMTC
ncbi:MAG TPA: hypothetical protein PL187_04535, partial [Caldilinea sp.]|nr:hypothetical protein [Caldilinea sp.]